MKYERVYAFRYGCKKCTKLFYNTEYYDSHLVLDHKIRNTLKHNPVVIKKLSTMLPYFEQDHNECEKLFHCIECGAAFFYEDSLQYHETKCYKQPLEERNASAERFFTLLEEMKIDLRKKRYQEDKEKAKKAAESKEKEISDSKTGVSSKSKHGRSRTKEVKES